MNFEDLDKKYIWHPFTHLNYQRKNTLITKARGVYLYTQDGRKIIDAIGSWWVNVHGHSHPYIVKQLKAQLDVMEHCVFSGFTHAPAIRLAAQLAEMVPINHPKIFYSDNGSTAVEVGIKMALQYFYNKQQAYKTKIIAFRNAYHGDTFGGMSVAARNVFNQAFRKNLFSTYFIEVPNEKNFEQVKNQLIKYIQKKHIAAFIFEPLVQGAGGMRMYEALYLDELMRICKENDVLCIADEVFTGFGKTGKLFACAYLKNTPDILCLSKGLTGGFLPLGVTVASDPIYQVFVDTDKRKTFYHGHSFTANPLMCTAALANIHLIRRKEFFNKVERIAEWHERFVQEVQQHKMVKAARCKGLIMAIEIKSKEKTHYLNTLSSVIEAYFIERSILLRPLGNVLYVVPPVCITKKELHYIYSVIRDFLDELSTRIVS